MKRRFPLRTLARIWILSGFVAGALATGLWLQSNRAWQAHLNNSEVAGILLYHSLQTGAAPPAGVALSIQSQAPQEGMAQWVRQQADTAPTRVLTEVSIRGGSDLLSLDRSEVLRLVIASDTQRYAVADLETEAGQNAAQKLGAVTRLLASYCSEPLVYARLGGGSWRRIDGRGLWGCDAAPRDLRLPAVLLAALALAILLSHSAEVTASFGAFARLLQQRRAVGGPDSYSTGGPADLQQIVAAVNDHLAAARDQIAKRATVLSGVSHDLGTPATRLRLRAALIPDADLRQRLEADIDGMTGMIESVLTYTRSELSLEEPRQISLSALVEALVADYQDLDRPVSYSACAPEVAQGAGSVFSARTGQGGLPDARRVLVMARPILLQRALTNLVDNALKYGRRAEVSLEADSEYAVITVEDEGSQLTVEEIEEVLAPFQRGANAQSIDGFGLGLTIVATVAEQHGGSLRFEKGRKGLRARLEICRNE